MDLRRSWGTWLGSLAFAITVPFMTFKLIKLLLSKKNRGMFKEKVVVITGASSGIGEALAHEFYKLGCKVVLCARRRNELERVRMDLLQKYPTVPTYPPVVVTVDLSDLNSLEASVKQIIAVTGHIDYLINNGGISNRGSVVDTNIDVFKTVMTVNYLGTVAFTKAVLHYMIDRRQGHIIFMSSLQGLIAIPHRAAYGASKHALQAFSDTLRAEVAKYNINVTVISPGYIQTALSLNALTGSGDLHGQMDADTASGYSPSYVAEKISLAIACEKKEVILAPLLHRFVVMLRANMPRLYFFIMARRAQAGNH